MLGVTQFESLRPNFTAEAQSSLSFYKQDFRSYVILSDRRERKIPKTSACNRIFEGFFTSLRSVQNDKRKS